MKTTNIRLALLLLTLSPNLSYAVPCPDTGLPVVVTADGPVFIQYSGSSADFLNTLYLDYPPGNSQAIFTDINKRSPETDPNGNPFIVDLSPFTTAGTFKKGEELVFRIRSANPNSGAFIANWYSGLAVRNIDGKPHAAITKNSNGQTVIGFEDLPNASNCQDPTKTNNYEDLVFTLINAEQGEASAGFLRDNYLNYAGSPVKGSTKFTSQGLTFVDALGNLQTYLAKKPVAIANPASQSGVGLGNPDVSLTSYSTKGSRVVRELSVRSPVAGDIKVTTSFVDRLMIPTSANKLSHQPIPDAAAPNSVDSYSCYKVKAAKNGFAKGKTTILGDKLVTTTAKTFNLLKPSHLCAPAAATQALIRHPESFLSCYQIKGSGRTPFIYVDDAYWSGVVKTSKATELCLPSTLLP